MKLCEHDCKPCCDFCHYCIHNMIHMDGKDIPAEPIGCLKHPEQEYQQKARSCSHCIDFDCENNYRKRKFIEWR